MSEEKYRPGESRYDPLKHLAFLRHGFKDEIPKKIIHSDDSDNQYKVRGSWWTGVNADLSNAVEDGVITGELKQSIDEFIAKVQALKFGDDTPASLRTAAEIAWANDFIDAILAATGYDKTPLDLSGFDR